MVFSSIFFLTYFLPGFLLVYHFTPKASKNLVALLASILFYAWGAPEFLGIALGSILIDFYIVKSIYNGSSENKKRLLWASIVLNVGLLLYYKYFNFFIENTNQVLTNLGIESIRWTSIVLPIGISFYTFQKLSYTIDVYKKVRAPLTKLSDYALYILLFPQLIAGPIVRFKEIADQFTDRDTNNYNDKLYGFYRFSIGLGKKVLIANVLGEQADLIFNLAPESLNSSIAWIGVLCYTFQIYFDFSGYSDMAIGLGKLMGFHFPENFNSPYISQSISEFWRRWHITLGTWMRDYLYIPLGGNQVKSTYRLYLNLWLVFVISGLWHGAAWTFVIWGVFHGVFLIADRLFLNRLTSYIGKLGRVFLTFVIVMTGWVLFRSETLSQAIDFTKVMYSFNFESISELVSLELIITLFVGIVLSFLLIIPSLNDYYSKFSSGISTTNGLSKFIISSVLLVISIAAISGSSFNPFIYFRF